jgi:hypothetical protein
VKISTTFIIIKNQLKISFSPLFTICESAEQWPQLRFFEGKDVRLDTTLGFLRDYKLSASVLKRSEGRLTHTGEGHHYFSPAL